MKGKEVKTNDVKTFLEKLHFHGYIDCDETKLGDLIRDYFESKIEPSENKVEDLKTLERTLFSEWQNGIIGFSDALKTYANHFLQQEQTKIK